MIVLGRTAPPRMKPAPMARLEPLLQHTREEQKALINGLLGIIYDNYDSTRRIQGTVDSIYRMTVAILVFVVFIVAVGVLFGCWWGCRRYQAERNTGGGSVVASPIHGGRKSVPIEL